MKKLIAIALTLAIFCLFKVDAFTPSNIDTEANDELKLRVVQLSNVQWQSVKDQVNTNGYCHIKEQNVVLVITNGCPEIEHFLPIWNYIPEVDLERNKLHMKGKRGKKPSHVEPMPYVGQGTL